MGQHGLKVRLPNRNVTSRALPVRIHDLDPGDVKQLDSHLGFLRSVDFVYRNQNVNHPLTQRDDNAVLNTKYLNY